MRLLEYKVAWIDDQPEKAQGFDQRLTSFVARSGFRLKVDWISNASKLGAFLKSLDGDSEYDLILVDWKLGAMVKAGDSGVTVARDIRYKNPPSYVVFYSSESRTHLMGLIAKESIDGVYCVNRQHFVAETTEIVRASVRRFQDVDSLRGVFLSAVASFDVIVRDALIKGVEGLSVPMREKLIDALLNRLENFHNQQLAKIKSVDKGVPFSDLLASLKIGSSQELGSLIDLLSLATPSVSYQSSLERLKSYQIDFLPGRNDLAHVEESKNGGQAVVARNGRVWSPAELGDYRQSIEDHHDNLLYVRDALVAELVDHLSK